MGAGLITKTQSLNEYILRINKALLYLEEHIGERITLENLADAAYFSPFHFHRLFTSIIGETPNDFVRRIRLEKAAAMLLHQKSKSITDIALQCGFSSSAVFSRSFKKQYGISATEWIEKGNSKIGKINSKNGKSESFPVDYFLSSHNQTGGIEMKVEVKEMPGFHVAYVANLEGYKVDKIDQAWKKLCNWAGPRGLINQNTKFIGISFDDPDITDEDKCRYYACLTIPNEIEHDNRVSIMDIAGGKHAVYRFIGTADEIKERYKELYSDWLPESGYEPANEPCYEIYIEEPKGDPMTFVMDICIPVKAL